VTCVILTTDTLHHRYFVNRIARTVPPIVVLERRTTPQWKAYWRAFRREISLAALVENPYLYRAYRRFHRLQDEFERDAFFRGVPADFTGAADLIHTDTVNSTACLQLVDSARPSLIVSFGTGLIGRELLGRPGLKINVHRGILPRYRGLDSDLWACWFRDFSRIGTSIHLLDAALDTGAVVEQQRLALTAGMRIHHLRHHTTLLAADIVERVIGTLGHSSHIETTPQDASRGSYYSYIPPIRRALAIRRFNKHVRGLEASPRPAFRERRSGPQAW